MPARASDQLIQACPADADLVPRAEQDATDRDVVCLLLCCCHENPSIGLIGQRGPQACVDQTLDTIDQGLGYQSRFKSEVSYNMMTTPPTPYMHRDWLGGDTTQRSTKWMVRVRQMWEVYRPGTKYPRGEGLTRRPDVVIVDDPTLPPIQGNIRQIYELKFDDQLEPGQLEAYQVIAGGKDDRAVLLNPQNCGCGDERQRERVRRKVENSEAQKEIDAILRRKRLNDLIGPGPSLAPTPGPGAMPLPLPP